MKLNLEFELTSIENPANLPEWQLKEHLIFYLEQLMRNDRNSGDIDDTLHVAHRGLNIFKIKIL